MKAEIEDRLDELTEDALLKMGDLLNSDDEKIQLAAARDVLDRRIPVMKHIQTNGGPSITLNISSPSLIEGLRKVKAIKGEVTDGK